MSGIATYHGADLPQARRYVPYGACLELLRYKGPEVLISGPAGTGKSRSCLEKLHIAAERYPGMRGLILRKTRASLTEAALVTFESHVLPVGHPVLRGPSRAMRRAYHYPNGSEIIVTGLDDPSKVMSTEFDLAYVQEAIEAAENDWEMVTTRLRNHVMPYQQLLADTNPDAPSHWLKQRTNQGRTLLLESRHEDNPTVTRDYLAKLDALTGVRYQRLRLGLWVAAEGQVYEGWDPAVHIIDRFVIPEVWPRYWSVDFGFVHPFVWQAWAGDPDGRLYRYREVYHTQRLVEDHAAAILAVTAGEPKPRAIICDHDAEDRATLARKLGMGTVAAMKAVSPGLQAVAERLRLQADGRARLFFLRDSVLERDAEQIDRKRPAAAEEEPEGYVWDTRQGRKKGEEPLKENDHGMDATRYLVAYVDAIGGGLMGAGQSLVSAGREGSDLRGFDSGPLDPGLGAMITRRL